MPILGILNQSCLGPISQVLEPDLQSNLVEPLLRGILSPQLKVKRQPVIIRRSLQYHNLISNYICILHICLRTLQNKLKPLPFSPNLLLAIAWNRKQYFDITYHLFLNFKQGTKSKKKKKEIQLAERWECQNNFSSSLPYHTQPRFLKLYNVLIYHFGYAPKLAPGF